VIYFYHYNKVLIASASINEKPFNSMKSLNYLLKDEQETINVGGCLAEIIKQQNKGLIAYLHGGLGAGKTTLTRGFVRGMGHQGNVKSPTYTLVEPYDLGQWQVYHFDLYRLADAEELEYMGIRDYFNERCCCFIEWPEKGVGFLVNADLSINIAYSGLQRQLTLTAESPWGDKILNVFDNIYRNNYNKNSADNSTK
jgi:tRNA threonylcarbamoyladenosine biosynthesis protein TsaE